MGGGGSTTNGAGRPFGIGGSFSYKSHSTIPLTGGRLYLYPIGVIEASAFLAGRSALLLGKIFERFRNGSPVTVSLPGTMEYAPRPELLDQRFSQTARRQYTHQLLFATRVALTSLVVCRGHRSPHIASQADAVSVGVRLKALSDKRDPTEPAGAAALAHHGGQRLIPVLQQGDKRRDYQRTAHAAHHGDTVDPRRGIVVELRAFGRPRRAECQQGIVQGGAALGRRRQPEF